MYLDPWHEYASPLLAVFCHTGGKDPQDERLSRFHGDERVPGVGWIGSEWGFWDFARTIFKKLADAAVCLVSRSF